MAEMFFYGSARADEYMTQPENLPELASLARDIISSYLGERYNPEELSLGWELLIRQTIKFMQDNRRLFNEEYDMRWFDAFVKSCLNLPHHQERLKTYNGTPVTVTIKH